MGKTCFYFSLFVRMLSAAKLRDAMFQLQTQKGYAWWVRISCEPAPVAQLCHLFFCHRSGPKLPMIIMIMNICEKMKEEICFYSNSQPFTTIRDLTKLGNQLIDLMLHTNNKANLMTTKR